MCKCLKDIQIVSQAPTHWYSGVQKLLLFTCFVSKQKTNMADGEAELNQANWNHTNKKFHPLSKIFFGHQVNLIKRNICLCLSNKSKKRKLLAFFFFFYIKVSQNTANVVVSKSYNLDKWRKGRQENRQPCKKKKKSLSTDFLTSANRSKDCYH